MVLASVLVATAVLQSRLLPLCLLVVLGASAGLLFAVRRERPGDLVRVPVEVGVVVLVLVGIGQLGVLGILLGLALLVTVPLSR